MSIYFESNSVGSGSNFGCWVSIVAFVAFRVMGYSADLLAGEVVHKQYWI